MLPKRLPFFGSSTITATMNRGAVAGILLRLSLLTILLAAVLRRRRLLLQRRLRRRGIVYHQVLRVGEDIGGDGPQKMLKNIRQ